MPSAPDKPEPEKTLVIACGALGREIVDAIRLNGWAHLSVTCLPAIWHNRPGKIPEGVRRKIAEARGHYGRILVAFADCGTGGELDRILDEEGVERIDGPHCYAFYEGLEAFEVAAEKNPACFYLTDYLARHFDRLIIEGLGIDQHPELLGDYFGNYTTLVYLAQTDDPALQAKAEAAAEKLGLDFEMRTTGLGGLGGFLAGAA